MDWLGALVRETGREWPTVTAAPELSVTILTIGLIIGWAAAWLILKQRLTHHKELVEQYEKAAANKKIARPKARGNQDFIAPEGFTIPMKLMLSGVISFVALAVVLYTIIHAAVPSANMAARLQFSPKDFFHDIADTDKPDLLKFNGQFVNTGNIPARRPLFAVVGTVSSSQESSDYITQQIARLRDVVKDTAKLNRFEPDIDVNTGRVLTIPGIYVTKGQMQGFSNGNTLIYVLYSMTWEDDTDNGYWEQDFCAFYQGNFDYAHGCGFTPITKINAPRT
jgi:hypothetical protein